MPIATMDEHANATKAEVIPSPAPASDAVHQTTKISARYIFVVVLNPREPKVSCGTFDVDLFLLPRKSETKPSSIKPTPTSRGLTQTRNAWTHPL
eukprot:8843534-Ditylum_brightwellii.AAC.1